MLRSLAKPRMVLTRTHSPSKSHHTTEVCGDPSGMIVVRAATGGHWTRLRCDACREEVADGLHDLGRLLQVRTVAGALDDTQAGAGDPGRQLALALGREHE